MARQQGGFPLAVWPQAKPEVALVYLQGNVRQDGPAAISYCVMTLACGGRV